MKKMETANLNKEKIAGKKIGVVFGTFAPLHNGHQAIIYKALMENDGVVLIVSGYKGDRGDVIGLPLEKRFRYLREAFNDELNLRIDLLDESDLSRYPEGWDDWTLKFNDIIQNNLKDSGSHQFKAYVGEPEYVDELKKRLPHNFEINLQDRTLIPITATEIREHPLKHWNSINRIFRRHFTKKVLVAGSASTGKSTLVKRLARTFNAPFSEEYARLYEEQNNVTDAELKASDYAEFIMGQWNANYKEVISPSNNGLTIFDTDVMVTRAYAQLYLSTKDNQELESIFNLFINKQDFDLIFIIPPITEYVNDGFRNMDWEATKMDYHQTLLQIIKKYGFKDKVVILDDRGNDKYEGFYLRYLHAVSEVNQLLK